MDIAVGHRPGRIIFGDQRIAIVEEPAGGAVAARYLVEAAQRVIAQLRARAIAGPADQPVLAVIDIAVGGIRGEVAIGIIGEAGIAGAGVLVQTVGDIGALDGDPAIPGIAIVGPVLPDDLPCRIVDIGPRAVIGFARKVDDHPGQPPGRILHERVGGT